MNNVIEDMKPIIGLAVNMLRRDKTPSRDEAANELKKCFGGLIKAGEQLEKDKALLVKENKDLKLLEDHYNRRDKINREAKALLLELLKVADCPQCKDKSGAYYDNNGEVCQCQWCYEVGEAIKQCGGEV